VDVGHHLAQARLLAGLHRLEGVEQRLFLARGEDAALEAEAAQRLDCAKGGGRDADGADERCFQRVYFAARAGEPIPARGGDVLGELA
jgi:hypothetical protein